MRRGEIAALRWRNIDLKRSRFFITESRTRVSTTAATSTPKSGRSRTVDLDAATADKLRAHRKHQPVHETDGLVFSYPDGRPLRPDYISERFLRLAAKAGLRRIRFYDLRHTFATLALHAGVPVHVVAERLGHANPSMTLAVCTHVIPGQQADAAQRIADLLYAARLRSIG